MVGFAEEEKKRPGPKKVKKEEPASSESTEEGTTTNVIKTVDRWSDSLLASTNLSQVGLLVLFCSFSSILLFIFLIQTKSLTGLFAKWQIPNTKWKTLVTLAYKTALHSKYYVSLGLGRNLIVYNSCYAVISLAN